MLVCSKIAFTLFSAAISTFYYKKPERYSLQLDVFKLDCLKLKSVSRERDRLQYGPLPSIQSSTM